MKRRLMKLIPLLGLTVLLWFPVRAHEIYFCNEAIPTSRDFVANKLMNVIRNQIPNVTLATLRYKARIYFPYIEAWLKYYGIPQDFKYIPIVECGFRNVSSGAGARGFWQIMPDVARELNLVVTPTYDERDDPGKATIAACKLIRQHYAILKNSLRISSWVLTAAAYNFGPGNVMKTVQRQGSDYFNMKLNAETAEYVYRLIAVKELFERPELYMNGFGTNIFSAASMSAVKRSDTDVNRLAKGPATGSSDAAFEAIDVKMSEEGKKPVPKTRSYLVAARLIADGKPFRDGSLLTFELLSDLKLSEVFHRKGNAIKGTGWLIDDRVFVDLGFGHEVELLDKMQVKGLSLPAAATNKEYVVLRTQVDAEE